MKPNGIWKTADPEKFHQTGGGKRLHLISVRETGDIKRLIKFSPDEDASPFEPFEVYLCPAPGLIEGHVEFLPLMEMEKTPGT